MKIGIDATSLCRKITGIEYYTLNLVKNILKIDSKNEYLILFRKEVHPELREFSSKAKFLICPLNNQIFCEQIWIPYIDIKEKIDLMHFPAFPPGLLCFGRYVYTIFDATIWKFRKTLSWKGRAYMRPLTILGAKRCKKIITISENSRNDIIQYAHIPEEKIINAGMAINDVFKPLANNKYSEDRNKFHFPSKFILSVGTLQPRKNIVTLLKSFKILIETYRVSNYKLILVGRRAWGSKIILEKIKDFGLARKVIITGYVSDEELICLYNLADIFVYPSLYEGFALPALEAMACRTPVITSNTSSLPEVVEDAAIQVDPLDAEQLADAIYKVLINKELQTQMAKKGFERVKKFSWEKTVKRVIKVYEEVVKSYA